jgi:hypothetical protein
MMQPLLIAELYDGVSLHAIGGAVAVPNRTSWMPRHAAGWLPVQAYLFRGPDRALLLDTGVTVHRPELARALKGLVPAGTELDCLLSRWEPDAIINLPWLIEHFGLRFVHSVGELNPIDFFANFDEASMKAQAEVSARGATLVSVMPGDVVRVGPFEIEVLRTTLRLLVTNWFYERTTRTLFTTDSFGFLINAAGPALFKASRGEITAEQMIDALSLKFEWLAGANCEGLIDDLRRLRGRYPIDRICPMSGGIIEGATLTAQVFDAVESALATLAGRPQRPAFAGFDWQRALSAEAMVAIDELPRPSLVTVAEAGL